MPFTRALLNKDYVPPDISKLDEVTYCINCIDQVSGRQGSFIFDDEMYRATGTHWAMSDIFLTVDGLFDALRGMGFTQHSESELFTVRREKKA